MYSHLSKFQRISLSVLRREGLSLRAIAKRLKLSHSSLSRELKRNPNLSSSNGYHAAHAHRLAKQRRLVANQRFQKILADDQLACLLETKLAVSKWSPEQISGWLRLTRAKTYVCPRTIYDWLYQQRPDLVIQLHCRKGKYRRTRANGVRRQQRQLVAQQRHISNRPRSVASRKRYGHWEGDTIVGAARSGFIVTLVERKSGYLVARVLTKTAFGSAGFVVAAQTALVDIPQAQLLSLTLDNGPEMKFAEALERRLGLKVYYATPYHSWERGCNENANGLLRYFFPKKSSFQDLNQSQLDQAVDLLNNRPRKRLNWRTPTQMLRL